MKMTFQHVHVDDMLKHKAIEEVIEARFSPWASNVVLVKKKNGTLPERINGG